MEKKYRIANTNILVKSSLVLAESGFSPLFSSDFADADFTVEVCESAQLNNFPSSYTSRKIGVAYDGVVSYTTLFKDDGSGAYAQLVQRGDEPKMRVDILSECLTWAADMYYLLPVMNLHGILLRQRVLTLHASFVVYEGRALLFTAPSGIGKTTQAKLWESCFTAEIINGDRAAVSVDNGVTTAHSLPLAGTSGECRNGSFPLNAIVLLSQATGNSIERLKSRGTFAALVQNAVFNKWNAADTEKVSDIICDIANSVPVYSLACLPDASAARLVRDTVFREVGMV